MIFEALFFFLFPEAFFFAEGAPCGGVQCFPARPSGMTPEPLTRVATRVRAWTLTCQFASSAVAMLALAHPCALTGAAQRLGLSVYLVVCLGSSVSLFARVQSSCGCGARRVDLSSLARSPRTHFYACVLVDAALLVAMLLLVGNTEDARETHEKSAARMKSSAFHRIEVAAFAGALGWGAHVAHCAIAYVVYTTVERNAVLVDVGGLYQPLISNTADGEAAAFEERAKPTPASAAA